MRVILLLALLLVLRNYGEVFSTKSNENGMFTIGRVQNGTYVLHIQGGQTGRSYDPTDLLVKVNATASRSTLEEGGCGGSSLILSSKKFP